MFYEYENNCVFTVEICDLYDTLVVRVIKHVISMIKKLGPLSRITYFSVKISKFLLLLRRCIESVF